MLQSATTYDTLRASFCWKIPARYNIATSCCDRWADAEHDRVAVMDVAADDSVTPLTFGALRDCANRLANGLRRNGVSAGDRVAIMLPQGAAVPIAHMAVYKLGAIAVPLANVFGIDAIAYRLADSGASTLISNAAGIAKVSQLPLPESGANSTLLVSTDGADGTVLGFDALIAASESAFTTADTHPDDPAMMIYTSGTTGNPKGALHGHRVVLGHLPGVQMPHAFFPQPGDRIWTPADWAWAGGLLNILLPALHFGVPVVAKKFEKFDPEAALDLIARHGVRNSFVPPTALRMLRALKLPTVRTGLNLRTLASGGEALGEETYAWGREAFGLTINEFYGQTEANLVAASCAEIGVSRAGSMGKP
ncbi:MAG: AMP-binding protein, partial [Beijerinckiaceae bacterium]